MGKYRTSYDHLKLFIPYVFVKKMNFLLILSFTCNKQILYIIYCRIMTTGVYLNLAIALRIISNISSFSCRTRRLGFFLKYDSS